MMRIGTMYHGERFMNPEQALMAHEHKMGQPIATAGPKLVPHGNSIGDLLARPPLTSQQRDNAHRRR